VTSPINATELALLVVAIELLLLVAALLTFAFELFAFELFAFELLAFEDTTLAAVDDVGLVTTGELLATADAAEDVPVAGMLDDVLTEESLIPTNSERINVASFWLHARSQEAALPSGIVLSILSTKSLKLLQVVQALRLPPAAPPWPLLPWQDAH